MKLITLNIWGGHICKPLLNFIEANQDIDIFCLQEVYHRAPHKISTDDRDHHLNIFSAIQELLPHHRSFFSPVVNHFYGIGSLVKESINVLDEGEIIIHRNDDYSGFGPTHSRNLQWLVCDNDGKMYSILNIHGLWNGCGKTDSPQRIAQSHRIREFMNTIHGPKILCGDFNLRPDTESIKILENDMKNLIKLYAIKSTRTSFYSKEEKFADYIFTSPHVAIKSFQVLKDEVSDHAPLFIEFV